MDKNQKTIIISSLIVFIVFSIGVIILFLNKDKITKKAEFIVPEFETSSIEGQPENVDESLTYQEVNVKEDYIVSICATPKEENGKLTLYFTSNEKNVDLLKIRIFDANNIIIGESGLLKPNSYVKDIALNRSLEENEGISVKVMSYEKDTYYSNGSFKLNVFVTKDGKLGRWEIGTVGNWNRPNFPLEPSQFPTVPISHRPNFPKLAQHSKPRRKNFFTHID